MSAGMRRVGDPEVSTRDPGDEGVVTVVEPVIVGDVTALGIDVSDPAQSPVGTPVALRRESDGILRPDADALRTRPTRDEVQDAFAAHVGDDEPHPAYDDLPDLALIFENRLV